MKKPTIKNIYKAKEVRTQVLEGLNKIAEPVIQTLSPKGGNVLYDTGFSSRLTNDGVTIAKEVELEDPVENLIANTVKQGALRTNAIAGDGTTGTVLLTKVLVEEGYKLIDNGKNPMELKRELEEIADTLVKEVEKSKKLSRDEKTLKFVAAISANNDSEIADKVVEAVQVVGDTGAIIIDESHNEKTELVKEQGFILESGLAFAECSNQKGKVEAQYSKVKVLLLDKRIYYPNDALKILQVVKDAGHNDVVIIARDFIGQAPNVFLANHTQGKMNILLIKDKSMTDTTCETLEDLATYLGTKVVSEKKGSLTSDLTINDFGTIDRIIATQTQSLIVSNKQSVLLAARVKSLRSQIEKERNDNEKSKLEKRLASMTTGLVTVKVGGRTPIETTERIFRYEDAINATRNAYKDGFVVGGGLTILNAGRSILARKKVKDADMANLIRKYTEAHTRQIAINCGAHADSVLGAAGGPVGYNAMKGEMCSLLDEGVIEPITVLVQTIKNSFSVAISILSSGYFIVNKPEEKVE